MRASTRTFFTFEIDVESDADFDYYDLLFAVAGKYEDTGELFYAAEHFYLQVMPAPGDLTCDGAVNNFDITPFVLVLTGTAPDYPEYYAMYPDCDHMLADCNQDGAVNNFDITPFVDLLVGD